MPTEGANYIHELVASQPQGATDYVAEGDDELRQLKNVLTTQFPDIITKGVVNADGTEAPPDPDERLWSPDALLAWLIANWDAFSQTPTQTALSMRAWNSQNGSPSQQALGGGATKMPMDVAAAFTGGTYDTINYRWIPGELGTYLIHGQWNADPSSGDSSGNWYSQIRLWNGSTSNVVSESHYRYTGHNGDCGINVTDVVEITDVAHGVEFWFNTNTGGVNGFYTNRIRTYFAGHKISSVEPAA